MTLHGLRRQLCLWIANGENLLTIEWNSSKLGFVNLKRRTTRLVRS